jgi:hypothetical protein
MQKNWHDVFVAKDCHLCGKSKVVFMERICEEIAFNEMLNTLYLTSFVQPSSKVRVPLHLSFFMAYVNPFGTLLVRHRKTLLRALS